MKTFLTLLFTLASISTFAAGPTLSIPTQAQLDGILEDFNGNMVHTTASGANSATVLGFELGVIVSSIASPNLELEDASVDKIANGGLYAKLELPLGFGVEAVRMPLESDDMDYDYTSLAAYYSFSGTIDTKLKVFSINSEIEFRDTSGIVVNYENKGYGANLVFGKKIFIIEPYVGVGYTSSESSLTASADIFAGNTTLSTQAGAGLDASSTYFMGGIDIDLLFLSIGIEASNPYGNNRIAGRAAFGF